MLNVNDYGLARNGTTDDSANFIRACQAAMAANQQLYIPGGGPILLTDAASQNLQDISIFGDGIRDVSGSNGYGYTGSQLWITGTTKSPFLLGGAVHFEGLNFFWPGQTEAAAAANGGAPTVYPPLFSQQSPAQQVNRFDFVDCQVTNCYDFLTDIGTTNNTVLGALNLHRNHIYAVNNCFTLQNVPEVIFSSSNLYSWGAYGDVVNGSSTTYLKTYTNNNGHWLKVVGDGTATTQSSTLVQGFFSTGDYVLGPRYGIRVVSGFLDISEFNGTGFDTVPTVLSLDTYGNTNRLRFRGGKWFPIFWTQNTDSVTIVIDNPGGSNWASVSLCDIDVPITAGTFATINGSNIGMISLAGVACVGIGHSGAGSSGYTFAQVNAPNCFLRSEGCDLRVAELHTGSIGIQIDAVAQSAITGTTFGYLGSPLIVNTTTAPCLQATTCCSYGSQTNPGISGSGASTVSQANNYWL